MMIPANQVIQNLKNMVKLPEVKEFKELKFESGVNLISSLAHLEEKAKSHYLKKFKSVNNDFTLGKRGNPYSRDENSDEFYYLTKRTQVNPIIEFNALSLSSQPILSDITGTELGTDDNDNLKLTAAIKVNSILTFLKAKNGQAIDEEEVLTREDYNLLELLQKDENALLRTAGLWLSMEIAHVSPHANSYARYFELLSIILDGFATKSYVDFLITIDDNAEMFLKFFRELPLINEKVFRCLVRILEMLQGCNSITCVDINSVMNLYQELLDKHFANSEAFYQGLLYFLDIGGSAIKLIKNNYYQKFRPIVQVLLNESFNKLKDPSTDEKSIGNFLGLLLAFAFDDHDHLRKIFEHYPDFTEKAKSICNERAEKFFGARFKKLDQSEISFIGSLFIDFELSQGLLDKLNTYLWLHLPSFGLNAENQASVRGIDQAFKKRKRVVNQCNILFQPQLDPAKIDANINNFLQDDIKGDAFVYIHQQAVNRQDQLKQLRDISKSMLNYLQPEDILNRLIDICSPHPRYPLSPLCGITILLFYLDQLKKVEDPIRRQNLYNLLLDRVLLIMNGGGWQDTNIWEALSIFLTLNDILPQYADALLKLIPQDFLDLEDNAKVKAALERGRK